MLDKQEIIFHLILINLSPKDYFVKKNSSSGVNKKYLVQIQLFYKMYKYY